MRATLLFVVLHLLQLFSTSDAVNLKKLLGGGRLKNDEAAGSSNYMAGTKNTCDTSLAKALVQANEDKADMESKVEVAVSQKKQALETISHLELQLQTMNTRLEASQAKEAATKAHMDEELEKMKKWWQAKMDDVERGHVEKQDMAKKIYEELLVTKDQEILAIQNQAAEKLKIAKEEAAKALQKKDEELAALVEDAAAKHEKLKQDMEERLEKAQIDLKKTILSFEGEIDELKEKNAAEVARLTELSSKSIEAKQRELLEKHDQKQAELELIKKRAEEEKRALLQEKEEGIIKVSTEFDSHKRSLEEKHNAVVSSLKLEMETKEKKAMKLLKVREEELESKIADINKEAERQLKLKNEHHSSEREKLLMSIKKMEKDHAKLDKKLTYLDAKYASAAKEIDEWQALYRSRSYCNFTHLQEDAAATVATVSKATAEQLSVATRSVAQTATEKLSVAGAALDKAAKPHISKGRQLYNQHLKEHVDKHILAYWLPFYENHLKPTIGNAKSKTTKSVHSAYTGLVSEFASTCPQLKRLARDQKMHATVRSYIRDKCKTPKDTVDRFLMGAAIILCLLFRNFLWRTVMFVIFLPLRLAWFLTPLPLLFPAKTHVKKDDELPPVVGASPVKVENKNGDAPSQ